MGERGERGGSEGVAQDVHTGLHTHLGSLLCLALLGLLNLIGVRVRIRIRIRVRVRVRVRGGLLPTTSHSISYTMVNAEGSPLGGLSGDLCRNGTPQQ